MSKKATVRVRKQTRKLLPFLLIQLLMISLITVASLGSWSARRKNLVDDAQRRAQIQGNLLTAAHASMLNSFTALAKDIGELDLSTPLSTQKQNQAWAELSGFIKSNLTFDRVVLLDRENHYLLEARRVENVVQSLQPKDGIPGWINLLPETTFTQMDSAGYMLTHLETCLHDSSDHSYLTGLRVLDGNGDPSGTLLFINRFGMFANWMFRVSGQGETHDYLLDDEGRNLIRAPEHSSSGTRDNGTFMRGHPDVFERMKQGEWEQITKQGIFVSYPLVLSGGFAFDPQATNLLNSLNWMIVVEVPAVVLQKERWASIRWLLFFGVLLDVIATWLLASSLRARRERLAAQERINQMNATLTSIIDGSPLAIIVLNRRGHVLHWNAAAEEMFGWTAEEVIGTYNPIVDEAGKAQFEALFEETISTGAPIEKEVHRRHRNGHLLDLHLWTTPIAYIDGRASAILGILADVSEQHRHQEAEARAKEVEAARMMARTVAHEFRQPLAVLSIMAELAEMHGFAPSEMHRTIQNVPKIVSRMDALVDKLLNITELHDKTYWRDINILDLERTYAERYSKASNKDN